MLSFACDYLEGAHPRILQRLAETNLDQLPGYGADGHCARARDLIRAACGAPEADVFFLAGGTQTNQVVISSLLRTYEGVVAPETGHVNLHEGGAIELSGHKVLALPARQGKISHEDLWDFLAGFYQDENREHMVFPGMVYLSWPTEFGTLYSKAELEAIYGVCQRFDLPLFLDGARLGYGLGSPESDLTLPEIARLCDVFYIGGTKVGALLGEAVVFPRGNAPARFFTVMKQHGAVLAKGRVLGVQFETLFEDGLYFDLGRRANETAQLLRAALHRRNIPFYLESPTNQQFVILENERLRALRGQVGFDFWELYDEERTVVRFTTSWATSPESIEALEALL